MSPVHSRPQEEGKPRCERSSLQTWSKLGSPPCNRLLPPMKSDIVYFMFSVFLSFYAMLCCVVEVVRVTSWQPPTTTYEVGHSIFHDCCVSLLSRVVMCSRGGEGHLLPTTHYHLSSWKEYIFFVLLCFRCFFVVLCCVMFALFCVL